MPTPDPPLPRHRRGGTTARPGGRRHVIGFAGLQVQKIGVSRIDLRDPYRLAVALSWPRFLLALFAAEMALNVVFAALYALGPGAVANAAPGSLADDMFFSLETLATVGYGEMYPATLYGHLVASAEIVCGLLFTAVATGLLFVRFSRPKPCFRYAAKAVVARHRGRPTLMLRIGNGQLGVLSDVSARLHVLVAELTEEGQSYRNVRELRLERDRQPLFALAWTLMHVIDETSPLAGLDAAAMRADDIRLFLTLEAQDPALSATIRDSRAFGADDILFGHRYRDAISQGADGRLIADMTRIGDVEPE